MQSIVSVALQKERDRMLNKMSSYLNKRARLALDALLENDDSFYQITLLKKDPKDFSTSEMRREVAKQQALLKVYEPTKAVIPKLNISAKNIEYYADMDQRENLNRKLRFRSLLIVTGYFYRIILLKRIFHDFILPPIAL